MRRTSGGRGSRSWRRLVASVAERPLLCVAMTFYWLWINLGFQMPVVFRPVVMGAGISVPSQLGPLFASAAAYLAISVWFARSAQDVQEWVVRHGGVRRHVRVSRRSSCRGWHSRWSLRERAAR